MQATTCDGGCWWHAATAMPLTPVNDGEIVLPLPPVTGLNTTRRLPSAWQM